MVAYAPLTVKPPPEAVTKEEEPLGAVLVGEAKTEVMLRRAMNQKEKGDMRSCTERKEEQHSETQAHKPRIPVGYFNDPAASGGRNTAPATTE
jgi:hypothetical protein